MYLLLAICTLNESKCNKHYTNVDIETKWGRGQEGKSDKKVTESKAIF
jgi:hypothetical protein